MHCYSCRRCSSICTEPLRIIIASAIIGYFVIVLANSTNKRKSLYRAFSYLALAAFVVTVLVVLLDPLLSISDRFYSAYSDVTRFSGNFRARVVSSSIALAVWLRAPIFGYGADFMWRTRWFALSDVGINVHPGNDRICWACSLLCGSLRAQSIRLQNLPEGNSRWENDEVGPRDGSLRHTHFHVFDIGHDSSACTSFLYYRCLH